MAVTPGQRCLQSDMAALAALANSKSTLPNYNTPGSSGSGNTNYGFSDWPTDARPQGVPWAFTTRYVVGQVVIAPNGFSIQCTTAGVSGSSSLGPAWPTTIGGTVSEGTVSWVGVANNNPRWLTELNRLRGNLNNLLTGLTVDAGKLSVSGPWPISGPAWSNHDQWFWFEDTGGTVNVTVSANFLGSSSGKFTTQQVFNIVSAQWTGAGWPTAAYLGIGAGGVPPGPYVASPTTPSAQVTAPRFSGSNADTLYCNYKEYSIVIGGGLPVSLVGKFFIYLPIVRGQTVVNTVDYVPYGSFPESTVSYSNTSTTTADSTDPASLVNVSADSNFPGTFSKRVITNGPDGETLMLMWDVNQTVAPGRYNIKLNISTNGDDSVNLAANIDPILSSGTTQYLPNGTVIPGHEHEVTTSITKTRVRALVIDSNTSVLEGASTVTFSGPAGDGRYTLTGQSGQPSISLTFSSAVAADGIDGTKNLFKIALPDWADDAGRLYAPGIYIVNDLAVDPPGTALVNTVSQYLYNGPAAGPFAPRVSAPGPLGPGTSGLAGGAFPLPVQPSLVTGSSYPASAYYPSGAWQWSPFPQPYFNVEKIQPAGSWGVSTSTTGFWTGITSWVSSLNTATPAQMPWNLIRTKRVAGTDFNENPMLLGNLNPSVAAVSNSYDNTLPVESQVEPPAWKANTYFSLGFRIMTTYGYIVEVTTAGTSGATYPGFAATVGGTSTDGTVTWTCKFNPRLPADTWVAGAAYPLGATVYDFNGNQQTSVDSWPPLAGTSLSLGKIIIDLNGNAQQVTTAGIAGTSQPAWATTAGANTTDGTVTWECGGATPRTSDPMSEPTWNTLLNGLTNDLVVTWMLTKPNRTWWQPSVHRQRCVPRYPVYWQGNNTIPSTWTPATAYALNATCIDANGNTQKVTTAGTSAGMAPAWNQTLSGVTSDGGTLKWTLITISAETIAALKPPTTSSESEKTIWGCGNQWQRNSRVASPGYDTGWQQDNLAKGWWIYSVSLNRMILPVKIPNPTGAGDAGIGAGDTNMDTSGITDVSGEVMVTIGCIRSGSFVAFGTWATGQTIQVLWPIFTSDALVYQCSERVDIQAVAIASGGAGVSVGTTAAGYPICAAFVSDVQSLLNLIT